MNHVRRQGTSPFETCTVIPPGPGASIVSVCNWRSYFGAPPLFFVPADGRGIELGKDHVRTLVERYHQQWRNEQLPRRK